VSNGIRPLLANFLVGLVVTCLSLIAAEALLRRFSPLDLARSQDFRVPHEVLGWVGEPGRAFRYRVPRRETILVAYNSLGLRDVEHEIAKPPGARRIVVLGDSFMEAYSVGLSDSFARRLEARLRAERENAEVINLGVGGYGTLQEYLIYRELGAGYAPDLVLLGFFTGNDLRDNSLTLQQASESGSYLKRTSRPFLDAAALPGWHVVVPDYASAQRRYRANRHSLIARLMRSSALLQAFGRAGKEIEARLEAGQTASAREALAEHGQHYCNEPPEIGEAWQITRAVLQRLQTEVSASGARLVVFSVPSLTEADRVFASKLRAALPTGTSLCIDESPPRAIGRLAGVLRELGIPFVDLLPAFRAAIGKNPEQELFVAADRHWNERGHELAARAVEWALQQRGSRAARARP
jgi:hypothetical protein